MLPPSPSLVQPKPLISLMRTQRPQNACSQLETMHPAEHGRLWSPEEHPLLVSGISGQWGRVEGEVRSGGSSRGWLRARRSCEKTTVNALTKPRPIKDSCVTGCSFQWLHSESPSAWGGHKAGMGFPGGSVVKNLCAKKEMRVQPLDREFPLEKEMATLSSILPRKSHQERRLVGYSPQGCTRVRHDLAPKQNIN